MNITLPKDLRNTTAVYSHVLDLFNALVADRDVSLSHTEETLTLYGKERQFVFNIDYSVGCHATFPVHPEDGFRGDLPVICSMLMEEYVDTFGEIIQQAIDYVDPDGVGKVPPSEHSITEDDVHNYKIDWNKWHDTVKESLDAFEFDNAADACKKLGLTWFPECDEDDLEVKAGYLRQDIEQIVERLIALHELKWDGKTLGDDGYKIFDKCHAYRDTDGELYAGLKLRQTLSDNFFEPRFEIRLVTCEKDIPWFNINLIAVGQFF